MKRLEENGVVPEHVIAWIEACIHPTRRYNVFVGMLNLTKEDQSLSPDITLAELERLAQERGYIN